MYGMITDTSSKAVAILLLLFLTLSTTNDISFCHGISNGLCNESERQALLSFKQDLIDLSNLLSNVSLPCNCDTVRWCHKPTGAKQSGIVGPKITDMLTLLGSHWLVIPPAHITVTWKFFSSSWGATEDCCKWTGIVCDNVTGHVQELHLRRPSPDENATSAEVHAYFRSAFVGKINPSLLNLKHLSHLDLSGNDFDGIQIPKFLGSMGSLRYLNLSIAGFRGMIPHQLGNLSSLHYLHLRDYSFYVEANLYAENLQWISGLSSLEFLDLSYVNLSKASDWLQVLNMLPSLTELHLSDCELDRIHPLPRVNFTSLSVLDLSWNNFNSYPIPQWAFSLTSLISLNLRGANFKGPILGVKNLTDLRVLDLSGNDFNSTIPDWLYSFSHLEFLDFSANALQGIISSAVENLTSATELYFSYNQLQGEIPRSLGNLCNLRVIDLSGNKLSGDVSQVFNGFSGCSLDCLEDLRLDDNKLYGQLPDQLGHFQNLSYLSLSYNSISGNIPVSLGSLSSLRSFGIGFNQLNGTLPESIGDLSKLEELHISQNQLEGIVSEVHFANLMNLRKIWASSNPLVLKVSPNWIPPFQLFTIQLGSWHLGPNFPMWLESQKDISELNLSCAGIVDVIPTWFWNLTYQLENLNLSHNQLHGEIPNVVGKSDHQPSKVSLASNQFTSPLPHLSSGVTLLDLSNSSFSGNFSHFICDRTDEQNTLRSLLLGGNLLSGEIPDCWMNWQSLRMINLENNNFTRHIPSSMGYINGLYSLHLRNNSLSGELPLSLQNCTTLFVVDLGMNEFVGSIPTWIRTNLPYLMVLDLHSNKFNGKIPPELCHLSFLQIMDLAKNNLSGTIPWCFGNLEGMAMKKRSRELIFYSNFEEDFLENAYVVTKGRENQYSTILTLVASLDLSSNNLSGEILEELTSLLGLVSLNLSNNHLSGRIPKRIADMGLLESLDFSRNQLSGEIPPTMSSMTFLSYLNLSYNNLSGKIPLGTQLQSFNASSFTGNELCGPPLMDNCTGDVLTPTIGIGGDHEEGHGFRVEWFYLSMMLGFVVGFWGICGPLLFNKSWRFAYFRFLDRMWDKLCDTCSRFY